MHANGLTDRQNRVLELLYPLEGAAREANATYETDRLNDAVGECHEDAMFRYLKQACERLGFRLVPINGGETGTEADVVNEAIETEEQL